MVVLGFLSAFLPFAFDRHGLQVTNLGQKYSCCTDERAAEGIFTLAEIVPLRLLWKIAIRVGLMFRFFRYD